MFRGVKSDIFDPYQVFIMTVDHHFFYFPGCLKRAAAFMYDITCLCTCFVLQSEDHVCHNYYQNKVFDVK